MIQKMQKIKFSYFPIFFLILIQFAMGDNRNNILPELDHQGRPVWEEGVVWVKVKPNTQANRLQRGTQTFSASSLNEKINRFDVKEIRPAFRGDRRSGRTDLPDLSRIFTLELQANTNVNMLLRALNQDLNVEYAERVPAVYQDSAPNDEFYSSILYHLPQIKAEEAWDIHKGEDGTEEVVIGICDTGVDWKHPDLGPNIYNRLGEDADGDGKTLIFDGTEWVLDPDDLNGVDDDGNGYVDDLIGWNIMADDVGNENNDPMDPVHRGHGSHCAGLAAGVTNNETGIASISWNVKVFGTSHGFVGDNGTSVYRAYEGLIYLAENGADIINASWGGTTYSKTAEDIIRYINGLGVIFISSAGNSDDNTTGMVGFVNEYPSSYPGCISVAAVDKLDQKAWYSTFAVSVDIAAPGGNHEPGLYSTRPGNQYGYSSGTSMASPLTAGLFGLVKSYYPEWTNEQLITQVLGTADNIDGQNGFYENWLGSGRINAFRALSETDVSAPKELELEVFSTTLSNNADYFFAGDTVDISFTIRNYSNFNGDSSATFTVASTDADVSFLSTSIVDTIVSDDFTEIGPFTFAIAEQTSTHETNISLNISSSTSEVIAGANTEFQFQVITVRMASDELNVNTVFGDTLVSHNEIINFGTADVNVSTHVLTRNPGMAYFHLDEHEAFDGVSWWAGNSAIGGYENSTLDYLDFVIGDLSGTSSPQLTFKTQWDIETPGGEPEGFDGWDGASVWISTDGGVSYQVLMPTTPAYTASSLFAFGEWNFGLGIPGWAGASVGWESAEFDLGDYKASNTVLRFVFASDPASAAGGFWVDDILVKDGATTLFENHGATGSTVTTYGFQGGLVEPDWVTLPQTDHSISASSSVDLEVNINSRTLAPGSYTAFVFAESDSGFPLAEFNLNLGVSKPEHDVSLLDYSISNGGFRIFRSDTVSVHVANYGQFDESEFGVALKLHEHGAVVFTDTVLIAAMISGQVMQLEFAPYFPLSGGNFTLEVEALNVSNDYNLWNDQVVSDELVTNQIDDFTQENSLWDMDGWGLTANTVGHLDDYSVHVDSGNTPYGPNLDHTLTYAQPLDLTQVDNLAIVFWTINQTEEGVDVMTFEVSTDGVNWDVLRSISGASTVWTQNAVDVSDYIDQGHAQLWFRFHFVSNESVSGMGLFVDDVAFHTLTLLNDDKPQAVLPQAFTLNQNYPNPFNPITTITYALPVPSDVTLSIYDISGRTVSILEDAHKLAGSYNLQWNGTNDRGLQVSTGVYFCRLQVDNPAIGGAGGFTKTIKMVYLK